MDSNPIKILLLVNWGLGLEILKTLHYSACTRIELVITRCVLEPKDRWDNVVYDFSRDMGYETIAENQISFDGLKEKIEELGIELLISHAYMRVLPKKVFSAPKYGSLNIHPSLLPKYRGPSPTVELLKNREKKTGLTCHYIDERVDTGDIVFQMEISVEPDDCVDSIIKRQKAIVSELVIESLKRVRSPDFQALPQSSPLVALDSETQGMIR